MRVIVTTCDKYDHLLPGMAWTFNKYWGQAQRVDVLGFRPPPALPPNFAFHSLAAKETQPWSTHLRTFFLAQPDEYFVWLLDDYWLIKPVNHNEVAVMEGVVKNDKADKGDLSKNTIAFEHTEYPKNPGLVLASQTANYRTSTQPCIWRRSYLLHLMQPGLNPWQFELSGLASNDGGVIVGPQRQIYVYANVCYKGKPHHMIDLIPADDRRQLDQLHYLDWAKPK